MRCLFVLLFFSFCMHCVLDDIGIANCLWLIHFKSQQRGTLNQVDTIQAHFSGLYKVIIACFCEKEISHFSSINDEFRDPDFLPVL